MNASKFRLNVILSVLLALGLLLMPSEKSNAADVPTIYHGTFGGAPYALVDENAVAAFKAESTNIESGSYASDTEYHTMEAMLITYDGKNYVTDRGGCIYIQTVINGLQADDIVEVDNNSFYDDGTGYYSYWDQAPYWVKIGDYDHNPVNTIQNWLIYSEKVSDTEYRLVVTNGVYNLAGNLDDLTTIVGHSFKLNRDVKIYRGATLVNPVTSSRGYITSTNEDTSAWNDPIAVVNLDTEDMRYIGVQDTYVDDDWVGKSNGDIVDGHIVGQDAFDTIQKGVDGVAIGGTVHVAEGTYVEQLLIQKDLTLVGAGIGQTIVQAPTAGRATAPGYTSQKYISDNWQTDYLLAAYPTDPVNGDPISVKVTGFTFNANGQVHIGSRFTGVYFRKVFNADINEAGLFNSEIKGFASTDPSVTGIRVLESSQLSLSGNTVKEYTILGIVVYGTDNLVDPIVTTTGNTLTPSGNAQGIQYRFINSEEDYSGTISNNTVNGGLIAIATSHSDRVLIERNTIYGGGNGIVIEGSTYTTVDQNIISGNTSNGIAVQSYGRTSDYNLISNNTISGIHSGKTSSLGDCGWGIGLDSYYGNVTNTTIENNSITSSDAGVVFYGVDATNVAHYNSLTGNSPYDLGNSSTTVTIDASPNWWGSMYGPAAGQIVGEATYSPWCGDAACSFLVSKNDKGEFIIESEDNINVSGGIKIDQPNTTILLKNGTVIQNNSPCFIVNADNTTIKAESPGGAKCVPTDSAHGIDITGDRSGIRIINMEIDGSAQTTGDGIHFGGKITDFQIVDNFIHDLDGDGIEFAGTASGDPHEIQGNLFQNNGGLAINAGSNAINAEYNSWGQYAETTIATVDTDPWTHVDLYLTGAPYLNQAVNGREITVKVMANLKNVTGAAFELQYDSAKVDFVSATPTIAFEPVPEKSSVLDASTTGLIKYDGYKGTGVTGAGIELYTVVFKAKALGEAALSFSPTTDKFSMSPTYGSSNYIYAAGLTGATVKVVNPPTITSSDIQGYYLTGETRDFYVLTENPVIGGDYQHALFKYVIQSAVKADIKTFQYYTGSAWVDMQLIEEDGNLVGEFGIAPTGFHMIPGHSANTQFHIEFNTAKNYPFILTLVDRDAGDYELARLDKTANVYTPPTLSSTFSAGPFLGGVEKDFTVTLNNPTTGINTDVKAKFTLYDALLADIAKIEYLEVPGDTWKDLPVSQDGSNLVGYFGPSAGFPMSAPYENVTSSFKVTFANGITKSYDYDIELFDTKTMPGRQLTKLSGTIDVYANYSLTGIFSMQGRTFRGGIPVTLTGVITGFGPYPLDSTDVLGINWNLTDVAAGAYTITTSQPRYLNVTAALNKTIDVTVKTAIAALELKGGDATGDNIIGTGDASVIGTQYGSSGADKNADVNFSGKVDIFDLALVGGNFNLTSATAYGIGNNIWIP